MIFLFHQFFLVELEPFIDSVAPKTNEDEVIIDDVLNNLEDAIHDLYE